MILESIVTTLNDDGSLNVSPMGPMIADDPADGFELRPFSTSQTLQNLIARPQGVMHVTDDVLLFAQAAIGVPNPLPPTHAAETIAGEILSDACRAYEFKMSFADTTAQRANLKCEVTRQHRLRDFWGFNRAKHAVLESAILATRLAFLPADEITDQFQRMHIIVEKTGGASELAAMDLLQAFVDRGGNI